MTPANWKPAVQVWRWEDAPEEFKSLCDCDPDEPIESVFYVPASLISGDADRDYDTRSAALNFLSFPPNKPGVWQGDYEGWGAYLLVDLQCGSRVGFTCGSKWKMD